jgi:hypothetical protein
MSGVFTSENGRYRKQSRRAPSPGLGSTIGITPTVPPPASHPAAARVPDRASGNGGGRKAHEREALSLTDGIRLGRPAPPCRHPAATARASRARPAGPLHLAGPDTRADRRAVHAFAAQVNDAGEGWGGGGSPGTRVAGVARALSALFNPPSF